MKKILFLFFLLVTIISCEMDELPIEPHNPGNLIINQLFLGEKYRNQIFFHLNTNSVTAQNLKNDWDIAFQNLSYGNSIIINSTQFSKVAVINNKNFMLDVNIDTLDWKYDSPSGIFDFNAMDNYLNENVFFIIDRGYDLDDEYLQSFKKIKIDSIRNNNYFIKYSNLDNTDLRNLVINEDLDLNFQYFSFDNNGVVIIEPKKENWDLLFTKYTHLFNQDNGVFPYMVTGVHINYLNHTKVAIDTINNFEFINYDNINNYLFFEKSDIIGYNWKSYSISDQLFTIYPNINYIIKTSEGRYFKLHFIDFYNDLGEKGYPKFEFQEL